MSWYSKPCNHYREPFNDLSKELYELCGKWPQGRSKKRDAMIEEIRHLDEAQSIARKPHYCIYEVWQNGHIEPCNVITWTYEDLCSLHKPFVESLPWEYRYKPKAGTFDDSRKRRNAFYGLSSLYNAEIAHVSRQNPQPKAIERILGKEKKPKPPRSSEPDGPIADSVNGYRVQNEMEE